MEVVEEKVKAYDLLRGKQKAFVDAYLANGFNATQAAIKVGYSPKTAYSIGSENLRKPDIKNAIQERMAEQVMSANETLARLSDMASFDLSPFVRYGFKTKVPSKNVTPFDYDEDDYDDEDEGEDLETPKEAEWVNAQPFVDLDALIKAGYGWAIKGIKKTKAGTNIEFFDKSTALQWIGKHHKLFTERQEVEFSDPVIVIETKDTDSAEQALTQWRKRQASKRNG